MSFEDVKYQVAVANRILAESGLSTGVTASLGHVSLRVPGTPDRFIVKGRGYALDALASMKAEDMVVCDLEGFKVEGPDGVTPCYEVKMHSCIYRTYPDVQSVVHVHPRFTVMMSVCRAPIRPMCNEGAELVRRPLPVYPHNKLILSDEEGMEVAMTLGSSKAVLLEGHGAATTGGSMAESVLNMLHLEEQARMNWYATCAFGPDHRAIPEELFTEPRARMEDLPHLAEVVDARSRRAGDAGGSGAWAYYRELVERGM